MTRDTQVTDIIETRTSKEPSPIGFFPAYLPNSSKENGLKSDRLDSPPYPVDASSCGDFPIPIPIPCSVLFSSNERNNLSDIKLNDFSSTLQVPPSAPTIINLDERKGLTNFERQEVDKALSNLESNMMLQSNKGRREFIKEYQKVVSIIDGIRSKLTAEEQNDFDNRIVKINENRKKYIKSEELQQTDEAIDKNDTSDEVNEGDTKCSFDISSLLPKFPQLVVDTVICVKGTLKGLTTVSGATYFTISLSAALFTIYYLILFCTCRRTKRTRISASVSNTLNFESVKFD